jgi:dynein heavy chain
MLQDRYTDSVNQRESLKQEMITTGLRLQRAAVLIDALANEKVKKNYYKEQPYLFMPWPM